jgi:hypothetical protein
MKVPMIYILMATASLVSLPAYAVKAKSNPTVKAPIVQVPVVKTTPIEGQAFLKTRGGDVKTCSSEAVYFYTKDDYEKLAKKRIFEGNILPLERYMRDVESYEKAKNGSYPEYSYMELKYVNEDIAELKKKYPQFGIISIYSSDSFNEDITKVKNYETEQIAKLGVISKPIFESQCDANGNFSYKNIPYGDYGIVTKVSWTNGKSMQGGEVGKKVTVDNNLQKVFITEQFPN